MKHVFGFFAILIVLSSCRPYMGGESGQSNYSTGYVFDDFWNGMNRNYVYWDKEPGPGWEPVLNELPKETRDFILKYPASFWDRIYDYYKPKFDELGAFADASSPDWARTKAKQYFMEMTTGLLDGHFRVYFSDGELFFPGQNRFIIRTLTNDPPGANAVFGQSGLTDNTVTIETDPERLDLSNPTDDYFDKYDFVDEVLAKYMDSGSFTKKIMVTSADLPGMLAGPWKLMAGERPHSSGGTIAYIFTNYCYLKQAYDPLSPVSSVTIGSTTVRDVVDAFFDSLSAQDVKGVIVDVRGNMGGDPADNPFLFGRMIDEPHTFAYSRSKSGEGRLDYSPWMPVRVIPAPATEKRLANTTVPIVLLADRGTFSGAEFHTMIVKTLPNGKVVGETTNGSASQTVDRLVYNGGAFNIGSFVDRAEGSVVQFRCADGNVYEGVGIPPDIEVLMSRSDWGDFYGGQQRDKQLGAAIRYIDPGATLP